MSGGCWSAINVFIGHQLNFFFSESDSNNMNPLRHCYYYSCGINVPIPLELKHFLKLYGYSYRYHPRVNSS